jgi:O-methyltransferase involved in polyketide biosynthesis
MPGLKPDRNETNMSEVRERHQVSDTAALVMLWANDYYQRNPLIRAYLHNLDLSAGKNLLDRYNRICPWYSEVIVNRKHFIRNTVMELIERDTGRATIVNLGAGFSPLALELEHLLSSRCRFIEIDQSGMAHKHALYTHLVPDRCGFISCIEADITDISTLRDTLEGIQTTHLVVVMEGLTYYIMRPAMEQVLSTLSGIAAEQSIIFEHLKPCRLINDERRFIPYKIFSHVRDYTTLDRMTTYSKEEIQAILSPDFICSYFDMSEMENRRTGLGTFFPTPDSGWLSCAVAVRRGFCSQI